MLNYLQFAATYSIQATTSDQMIEQVINFDTTNKHINEWNEADMGFTLSHNKFSVFDDNSFSKFLGLDLSGIEESTSTDCDT
jgi:hypothetical protein